MSSIESKPSPQQLIALMMLLIAFCLQGYMVVFIVKSAWFEAFLLHILSSLLFPWPQWVLLTPKLEKTPLILILFFILCFSIPFIAGLAILITVTLGSYYTKRPTINNFNIIEPPVIPENIVENIAYTQFIGGNIRAILESSTEEHERIRAVLATRKMSDQEAIPILQIALLDPIDEVRLLAYSMLNTKEKKISNLIQKNLNLLKDSNLTKIERASKHHYIAESYWELAYLGLEQGQAKIHVLEAANEHAISASEFFITDIELYFLRGRITLELGLYEQTAENFRLAQRYGMAEEKLAPYQAELAFAQRRFDDVAYFIKRVNQFSEKNTLTNMVNQWL